MNANREIFIIYMSVLYVLPVVVALWNQARWNALINECRSSSDGLFGNHLYACSWTCVQHVAKPRSDLEVSIYVV